jgi:hypothetical protein
VRTPNPAKVPIYLFGPGDYLVSMDLGFANVRTYFWIAGWRLLGEIYLLAVAIAWPFLDKSPYNKLSALAVLSLSIGFVASGPWWYAIFVGRH